MPTPDHLEVAPNISLHLRDWGAGRPIVFIHGWPLGHEMWEYQFNTLPQQGYRCIGITLRGFGRSSQPWGDHNYDVWADDVNKVLTKLDINDATLVGFSMGGAIALRYAARHNADGHINRLALCGAAAPSFTQRDDFPAGLPRAAVDGFLADCRTDRAKLLEEFGKMVFKANTAGNAQIRVWLYNLTMQASPHATAAGIVALRDTDLRDDMAKVSIPTLILHASDDNVCPFPLAEALAAGIQGAQLVRFDNSGHALFYEEREKFNDELARFAGD